MREPGVRAVARFAGLAVPDAVGQDDVILARVQQLALAEQHAAEAGAEKRPSASTGAVHHDYGVVDVAGGIARRVAQRGVMQSQLAQFFAGGKGEIADGIIALRRLQAWSRAGLGRVLCPDAGREQEQSERTEHSGKLIRSCGAADWQSASAARRNVGRAMAAPFYRE